MILRTFELAVTPPVGDYLCGGYHAQSIGVETPLFLQGLLLSSGHTTVALATVDFCYLSGVSHARLVGAIAKGAQIDPSHVSVHANHVHDAPLVDEVPHLVVAKHSPSTRLHNETWFASVLESVTTSVDRARHAEGIEVGAVSLVEQPVEEFASTRRVPDAKEQCSIRWSVCAEEAVRNAPRGKIDPILSQVVLMDHSGKPALALNFYASHPQVSDGRRMISSDTVGVARELFRSKHPDVPCMYFTGCAGDVTAGKYSTANRIENRKVFGERLGEAMLAAFEKREAHPISAFAWVDSAIDLPIAGAFQSAEELERTLRSDSSTTKEKYQAAQQMVRMQRPSLNYPFRLSRLSFGWFDLLFLPAEMVVEYQLFAKSVAKQNLAVAAYGDSYLMYVPTDEMFDQGGYEVRPQWTGARRGNEQLIKAAIHEILKRKTAEGAA